MRAVILILALSLGGVNNQTVDAIDQPTADESQSALDWPQF